MRLVTRRDLLDRADDAISRAGRAVKKSLAPYDAKLPFKPLGRSRHGPSKSIRAPLRHAAKLTKAAGADRALGGAASPSGWPPSRARLIGILVADIVAISIEAVVVTAVCGCAERSGSNRSRPVSAIGVPTCIAGAWAVARAARTPCYRVGGMSTSGVATAAVISSCTAVDPAGMHATATEATTMEAAATSTASIGVVGEQGCSEQDDCCESNENTTKHGPLSPF